MVWQEVQKDDVELRARSYCGSERRDMLRKLEPGDDVEIDESKFGRRKYNRVRLVEGHWVYGGAEMAWIDIVLVLIQEYDEIREVIRFDIKSVHRTFSLFSHVDSVKCLLWFELSAKCTKERVAKSVMCLVCLKNMINALFSSKPSGTKSFVLDDVNFGWNSVSLMFQRVSKNEQRTDLYGSYAVRVTHHTRFMDKTKRHTSESHADPSFQISNNTQKKFLAWQTLDLLGIDVNGFNLFCKYFLNKYPGYYIVPIRITGSAVESLFSPFKFSSGGKLDAANYSYSRGVSLIKQVTSTHHSIKDYRDGELAMPSLPLTKKENKKLI
uniref:Uncharacterized protein n=1 Tax=Amphimedon queenslandica TaxID=400682 RepID=A0A1X7VST4_AMPQE